MGIKEDRYILKDYCHTIALWAQFTNGSDFIWNAKNFFIIRLMTNQSFANLCLFLSDCYWYGSKQGLFDIIFNF